MSRFDRFRGHKEGENLPASAPGGSEVVRRAEERRARHLQRTEVGAPDVPRIRQRTPPCFAIALDATGSMAPLIDDARRNITTILARIRAEADTPVAIRFYAYRDYDVFNRVCEFSEASTDANTLLAWLRRVETTGGGANPGEAIEAALEAIERHGEARAVMLIGDEPSNPREDLDARGKRSVPSARDRARGFGQRNVPIHTFVVGDDPRTITDFAEIARLSGGRSGRLDGSTAMIDMAVMAMLASLRGADSVRSYAQRHRLTDRSKEFARLLIAGPGKG